MNDVLKVVVIEDEGIAARRIVRLLTAQNLTVLTTIASVDEGIEWFSVNQAPDLIVSDIQLSDGLSFDIFEEVEVNSHIIFTTAYNQYALDAFGHNSIDYLLKPIDEEDLEKAIEKYRSYYHKEVSLNLDNLKQALFPDKMYKSRFLVKVGQFLKPIQVNDVSAVTSENKMTYFILRSNKKIPIDDSLEKIGEALDPEKFYRVNRKHIVAKDAIEEIVAYSNSRLKVLLDVKHSEQIIVAREKVKDFKAWLEN